MAPNLSIVKQPVFQLKGHCDVSALESGINYYKDHHPSLYFSSLTLHPFVPSWAFRNGRE